MRGRLIAVGAMLIGLAASAPGAGAATAPSPWPSMRHDTQNTGESPIPALYQGDKPWSFATGRGLFITPVIGGDGAVYFGSADDYFYALNHDGTLRWKYRAGNIFDAAAALNPTQTAVTIGSADENLYTFSTASKAKQRVLWSYHATAQSQGGQLVDWWEGDIAYGPDGSIYTGNTGGTIYSFTPDGRLRWTHTTGQSVWTQPAFGAGGETFWGSVDRNVYALNAESGAARWTTPTLGFVISSPALGSDGTVYIGSFDSSLYALDPATGLPKWKFGTGDHIYSSPALGHDPLGVTDAVYIASTDGRVYKLSPSGQLLWSYDTGEPIRSSPVLGAGPDGTPGAILYVGSSDGSLYALNTGDGTRRWSFDTVEHQDPILRDRHELNSSPALGRTGVYIGSEDGQLTYIPYDYCLHVSDPRCDAAPGSPLGENVNRVYPVTPGGTTEPGGSEGPLPASAEITGRLVERQNDQTIYAGMIPLPSTAALVSSSPHFDSTAELSGDGRYVFIEPAGQLAPGTTYHVRVAGEWGAGGLRAANYTVPGTWTKLGSFGEGFSFTTAPAGGPLPLRVGANQTTAFEIRRLAAPLPAFLPSVNQIGFDSYTLLAAPIAVTPPDASGLGHILLWATQAKQRADGSYQVDPAGTLVFPLAGTYQGSTLKLSVSGAVLTFSFGAVPLKALDLGLTLNPDLTSEPEASLYASAVCADIPNYSLATYITGICNTDGVLAAAGTFITQPLASPAPVHRAHKPPRVHRRKRFKSVGRHARLGGVLGRPAAGAGERSAGVNLRPAGVSVAALVLKRPSLLSPGSLTATLSLAAGTTYAASEHRVGLLLTDAGSGQPIGLNYAALRTASDRAGNITQVTLPIPAGTSLPAAVRAYVITDVFPLFSEVF